MFFRNPYVDALIVVLILLLFFGPKRLPALGRSLGQGMREFKDSISGRSRDAGQEDERPQLSAHSAAEAAPASTGQPAEQTTLATPTGDAAPAGDATPAGDVNRSEGASQPRS